MLGLNKCIQKTLCSHGFFPTFIELWTNCYINFISLLCFFTKLLSLAIVCWPLRFRKALKALKTSSMETVKKNFSALSVHYAHTGPTLASTPIFPKWNPIELKTAYAPYINPIFCLTTSFLFALWCGFFLHQCCDRL